MKKCFIAIMVLCILLSTTGCAALFPFSYLLSTNSTTDPGETETTANTAQSTTVSTAPEETEPQVPEYILNTLKEELLFRWIDILEVPEDGGNTWKFRGNLGDYILTVVTENGAVTSVITDSGLVLYENGSVVITIESYEEDEYKKTCQEISYDDLARNPDSYKYDHFTFTGEVIQVYEDGIYTILRIDVTPYTIGDSVLYKDTIYAEVYIPSGADRILEDDIITVWGQCSGLITYESVFGQQISIPGLDIEYYEIVS